MFSDPIEVSYDYGSTHVDLPRTSTSANSATYTSADGNHQVVITQVRGKRLRRSIKLSERKIASDPLTANNNLEYSMTAYFTVDVPPMGFTVAQAKVIADALIGFLQGSGGAATTKLLGGEV